MLLKIFFFIINKYSLIHILNMNDFKNSTQYKNWIKTKEEIQEQLKKKIKFAQNKIKKFNNKIEEKFKKEEEKILSENQNESNINLIQQQIQKLKENKQQFIIKPPEWLIKKDSILIIYYTKILIKTLNIKIKSNSLKSYALTFFRRFFYKKCVLEYEPLFIFFASIYLGGKISSEIINRGGLINLDEKTFSEEKNFNKLIKYEFYLNIILQYDFYVYDPYKALIGFIYLLDKQNFFIGQMSIDAMNKEQFTEECEKIIDNTYLTDLIFLYSYSYLALSAIFIVATKIGIEKNEIINKINLNIDYNKFFDANGIYEDIIKTLNEIPEVSKEDAKEIEAKIKQFKHKYPKYEEYLNEERNDLIKKMNKFNEIINNNIEDNNKKKNNINMINNKKKEENNFENNDIINNNLEINEEKENVYLQNKRERDLENQMYLDKQ